MSEQSSDGTGPDPSVPGTTGNGTGAQPAGRPGPSGWVPGAELPSFQEASGLGDQFPQPAGAGPRADPYGDRGSGSAGAPLAQREPRDTGPSPQNSQPDGRVTAPVAPERAIDEYRVHHSRGPAAAVIALVIVILVAMAVLALRQPHRPSPDESTAPSPSPTASSPDASTSVVGAIPVETSTFTGTWQITEANWDSTGLTIDMTLTSTRGALSFTVFSFDNVTTDQVMGTGELASGVVSSGSTVQGQVRFTKDRNDTTVILSDGTKNGQITALTVPA